MSEQTFRMSQPRASFYPFYVEQGKTWDNAAKIAGSKRYPIRLGKQLPSPQGTKDMESTVAMLPAGTVFRETIRFNNLRPVELGALLSAITFHGNEESCYHSLGFGKPLGYGAVAISNIEMKGKRVKDEPIGNPESYMSIFEDYMRCFKSDWLSSSQLKELFLMAQGIPSGYEESFDYMELTDFVSIRKDHKSLDSFSSRINKKNYSVPSIKNKDNE